MVPFLTLQQLLYEYSYLQCIEVICLFLPGQTLYDTSDGGGAQSGTFNK